MELICVHFTIGVGIVNGLTVDWSAGHVIWTDERWRRIAMTSYDGQNYKVVVETDIDKARGIVIDPRTG